jgi:hypothetical protein
MEPIYGVEVRRQVKAGALVPPHYNVDAADVEEVANQGNFVLGGGTHPPAIRPDVNMPAAPPDYGTMTLPELKEAASDRGIMVTPDAKKADILAALEGK